MALVAHDAQLVRELPLSLTSPTHFSPNDRYLAVVSLAPDLAGAGQVRVIDLTTGQETFALANRGNLAVLKDTLAPITIGAIANDGAHVACISYTTPGTIEVREVWAM